MSVGHRVGHHRIQGISDEFIPPIVHLEELDEIVDVHDGDAIIMAQHLATDLGLGVGISSGANFLGAVKVQQELGADAVVVTVFPDSNKKYLSTDLLKDEPEDADHLSSRIRLHGFTSFNRVCRTVSRRGRSRRTEADRVGRRNAQDRTFSSESLSFSLMRSPA